MTEIEWKVRLNYKIIKLNRDDNYMTPKADCWVKKDAQEGPNPIPK